MDGLAASLLECRVWPEILLARARVRRIIVDQPEMRATRFDVPAIETPGDRAAFLELDVRQLDAFADRRGLSRVASHERMRHYRYRTLAKPDGGAVARDPEAASSRGSAGHLDRILATVPPHSNAHGCRAGRSVMDFVRPHVG